MTTLQGLHPPIGIVADDLTSAADGAGVFAARGLSADILRTVDGRSAAAAVALDTGSRNRPPADAARAVATAVAALRGARWLYKTVDSTLRGHVRVELTAAFNACGRERLVIAPAFPVAGRTTVNGVQRVGGLPVAQSAYAEDPVHPARVSRIADLIDPDLGSWSVVPEHDNPNDYDTRILIIDAASQTTLNHQVARVTDPESILWVGSPGLAYALAARFGGRQETPPVPPTAGRVLVVIGSANAISRRQCDLLQTAAAAAADPTAAAPILWLSAPRQRRDNPQAVADRLAAETAQAVEHHRCDALIVTGGDTADRVLQALKVQRFTLLGELEPGFPLGLARLGLARPGLARSRYDRPLLIGLKAGGFGHDRTLLAAARRLLADPIKATA